MEIAILTLIYVLTPVIIILLFNRYDWVHKVGTVILAYAVGIIMALSGLMPDCGPVGDQVKSLQSTLMSVMVPLAIPLMLFSCDFKLWTKSLPKTFVVLFAGLLSMMIAVVVAFFVFRDKGITDFPQVAAMITGIYTGGTLNFYALGSALRVNSDVIVIAYTFEMIVTFPYIVFLVGGGFKLFRKILPSYSEEGQKVVHQKSDLSSTSVENYKGMFAKGTFGRMLVGLLISVVMLAVGAGLSLLITGKLNEMVIILTITTLAIIASFSKKVRELPKTFELGMFFILIFSVIVASQFNIRSINTQALSILGFIITVLLLSTTLHLLLSRLFKVEGDLFVVGQVGLLCSPPFIPPVVGAMGNKKVLISGIVIGLVGYAIGTYLGLATYGVLSIIM